MPTEPAEGCTVSVNRRGLGWQWHAEGPMSKGADDAGWLAVTIGSFGWAWSRTTATWDAAAATHRLTRLAAQSNRKADLIARLDAAAGDHDEGSAELLRSAAAFLADRPALPPTPAGEGENNHE